MNLIFSLILHLYSAVVLAYNLCAHKSQLEKSVKNYLKYCLNRYISFARRLIGPIILILLLPLIGDGPIWPYFDQLYTKPCRNSLLSTFLFLNNYSQSLDDVVRFLLYPIRNVSQLANYGFLSSVFNQVSSYQHCSILA